MPSGSADSGAKHRFVRSMCHYQPPLLSFCLFRKKTLPLHPQYTITFDKTDRHTPAPYCAGSLRIRLFALSIDCFRWLCRLVGAVCGGADRAVSLSCSVCRVDAAQYVARGAQMAVPDALGRTDDYARSTGAGLLWYGRRIRYPLSHGGLPRTCVAVAR